MCNQLGARMRKNGSCGGQERKHHKHETQNCAKARRHGAARSAAGMQAAGEMGIDTSPESTTGLTMQKTGREYYEASKGSIAGAGFHVPMLAPMSPCLLGKSVCYVLGIAPGV